LRVVFADDVVDAGDDGVRHGFERGVELAGLLPDFLVRGLLLCVEVFPFGRDIIEGLELL